IGGDQRFIHCLDVAANTSKIKLPLATAMAYGQRGLISFRIEADQQLPTTGVKHRALDHRWLLEHQTNGLRFRETIFVFLGQFSKCRPRPVEENLPAHFFGPTLEALAIDACRLVIVKAVFDAVLFEPRPALFHGVAVFDTVYGNKHDTITPTRLCQAASTSRRKRRD